VSVVFNDNGKGRAVFFRVTAQVRQFFRHLVQFYCRNFAGHFKYFRADFRANLVPYATFYVNLHSHVMHLALSGLVLQECCQSSTIMAHDGHASEAARHISTRRSGTMLTFAAAALPSIPNISGQISTQAWVSLHKSLFIRTFINSPHYFIDSAAEGRFIPNQ
jgi:hypothetical protein